jgi:hypothetical protein
MAYAELGSATRRRVDFHSFRRPYFTDLSGSGLSPQLMADGAEPSNTEQRQDTHRTGIGWCPCRQST